jgi:hypothetical protein
MGETYIRHTIFWPENLKRMEGYYYWYHSKCQVVEQFKQWIMHNRSLKMAPSITKSHP